MPGKQAPNQPQYVPKSNHHYYSAYGGWQNFMFSFGLKPWDPEDVAEGKKILEQFKEDDRLEWEADQVTKAQTLNTSGKEAKTPAPDRSQDAKAQREMARGATSQGRTTQTSTPQGAQASRRAQNTASYVPKTDDWFYKQYGGRDRFFYAFGLRPWDFDDIDEAEQLLKGFKEDDRRELEPEQAAKSQNAATPGAKAQGTKTQGKTTRMEVAQAVQGAKDQASGLSQAVSGYVPKTDSWFYKQYGGRERFFYAFGLKPWDFDDIDEAERLLEGFREAERQEWEAEQVAKAQGAKVHTAEAQATETRGTKTQGKLSQGTPTQAVKVQPSRPSKNATGYVPKTDEWFYDQYDGRESFFYAFGLKPWDFDDIDEVERLLKRFKEDERQEWEAEQAAKASSEK